MKAVQLAAITTLITLGIAQVQAETTNVVQDLEIRLRGFQQGGAVTNGNVVTVTVDKVEVDTARVIEALGVANGITFSPESTLVLVTPLNGGVAAIQVRDTGGVQVNVTEFFAHQQLSEAVRKSQSNLKNGKSTATEYSIQRLALQDSEWYPPLGLHFDVNGFATEHSAVNVKNRYASEVTIDATGTGDQNGSLVILRGLVRVSGQTLEVVTDVPPES